MTVSEIVKTLSGFRYRFCNEYQLQDGVEAVVRASGWEYVREFKLSAHDRPDFWFPSSGVAVEIKVDGSTASVIRQIHRYAQHPEVRGIILISSRARHIFAIPENISGIPVEALHVGAVSC